jgi:hypothetical protein
LVLISQSKNHRRYNHKQIKLSSEILVGPYQGIPVSWTD